MRFALGVASLTLFVLAGCPLSRLCAQESGEVVLSVGNAPGTESHFKLLPHMPQRVVNLYLMKHPLERRFTKVVVASDVVASVYELAAAIGPKSAESGVKKLSVTCDPCVQYVAPRYSILVISWRRDLGSGKNQDLPLRVLIHSKWSTFLSGGHLHSEEFFVSEELSSCYNLGSVLQPSDRGADLLELRTGNLGVWNLSAWLYSDFNCRGDHLSLPRTDGRFYNLWDYDFGDRARSVEITWMSGLADRVHRR